jgi:acetyl esterase
MDAAQVPPEQELIRVLATAEPMTVEQARARARETDATRLAEMRPALMPAYQEDLVVPGPAGDLPVRVLRPAELDAGAPTIVYLHGGGWVVGGLDTHLGQARRLCTLGGAVVVSVDYRVAPEHRFPAAFDDALAGTRWVADNLDRLGVAGSPLVVAGDGSGGQLAASVAIGCRDLGVPLAAQVLLHPVTDVAGRYGDAEVNATYMSRWDSNQRWTLTLEALGQFARVYVDEADATDWRVSPKRAADLTGVAPAVVHTSTLDVLRTEGNFYADDLRAAGVAVISREFPSVNHSYFGHGGVAAVADAASAEAVEDLRTLLAAG